MTGLQVVSLFAGIGGIDRGLESAGVSTALLCELDPHARKILARHYPHAAIHNDVTELTADDCRAVGAVSGRTVLTAGWPCQGNSVAGPRGGMDDPRSGLWSHVVRLLAEFRPAWFIGENVPGLLSVNDGRDFSIVVHDLARLGYRFAWRILDARYFGVPQRRRRVVIVGRLGDTGAASAQVLLEPEGVPGDPASGITPGPLAAAFPGPSATGGRVVGVLGDHTHTLTAEGHDASEDGTGRGTPVIAFSHTAGLDTQPSTSVATTLKAGHDTMPSVAYVPGGNDKHDPTMMTYVAHEVSTLTAAGGERGYRIDAETAAGGHLVAFAENQRGELTTSDTLPALKVGGGKPGQGYPAVTDGVIVRRLSPTECERLQGFPDGWTEGQADSHRYKQLGNSVAVPVFEWVGRRLVAIDQLLQASA
jgi:DNA (cytosine-5)-methyltransferase 1